MISEYNRRVTATISEEEFKILKDEAEYQDRTISNLTARIIKYYLKNKNHISLE